LIASEIDPLYAKELTVLSIWQIENEKVCHYMELSIYKEKIQFDVYFQLDGNKHIDNKILN
jgi:hypothetical protein